jgi:signal peptidase I
MEIIPPKNYGPPNQAYQKPATGDNPVNPPQPDAPPPPPEPSRLSNSFKSAASTIGLFLSAFFIAVLLNTFIIQSYQVDGQSMEPTLKNDDRLIVNKVPRTISRIDGNQYVPHRGDIIIFNQEGLPGFVGQKQLIKRVIGLPGERVVVKDGKITVYNAQNPNGFNPDTTTGYHISAPSTIGQVDIQLKKDQLFVCGDNRPNSEDSRFFGPINTNQVVAKLVLRILPLGQAQSF